jgi:hypothetical protein
MYRHYEETGTAPNRTVCASPPVGGSGSEKLQSAYGLCAVFLRHIWGGGQCYALPYYPPQTSHTAGTLCAIGAKIFCKLFGEITQNVLP